MITKIILTSLFTVLFSAGLMQKSDTASDDHINSMSTEQVVRAIHHNGEIMPYYSLPVVEITAKINTEVLVHAAVIDGEVVPMIQLDEVVITPNSGMDSI